VVKESDIRVEGQTSGEWVDLGTLHLVPGKRGFVRITNKAADGLVVADAVLFIFQIKK
jgi:hypothetical protein